MIYVTSDDVAYLARPGTLEEMNERWTHGQYLALFSTTGFLGSSALLPLRNHLVRYNNEHNTGPCTTPDQRASSWLSRDLVLYGRSFKSVTNAKE